MNKVATIPRVIEEMVNSNIASFSFQRYPQATLTWKPFKPVCMFFFLVCVSLKSSGLLFLKTLRRFLPLLSLFSV